MRKTEANIKLVYDVIAASDVGRYVFGISSLYDGSGPNFGPGNYCGGIGRIAISSARDYRDDPPAVWHIIRGKEIFGGAQNSIDLPLILANRSTNADRSVYIAT